MCRTIAAVLITLAAACAIDGRTCEAARPRLRPPDIANPLKRKAALRLLAAAVEAAPLDEGKLHRSNAYPYIAHDQLILGDAAAARDTLRKWKATLGDVEDAHRKSMDYSSIAQLQVEAGDLADARDTLKKVIAAAAQDTRPYWYILRTQLAVQDFAGAEATLAGITDKSDREGSLQEMAVARAKAGDEPAALAAAAQITTLSTRVTAYTEIGEALAKAGDVSGARKVLAIAGEAAKQVRGDRFDLCNRIAGVLAGMGAVAEAKATAAIVDSPEWRESTYRNIADAQVEAGDRDGARETLVEGRQLLKRSNEKGECVPGLAERHGWIVSSQLELGDIEGAKATVATMPKGWPRPWIYREIVVAQANAGDFAGAEAAADCLLGRITDPVPSAEFQRPHALTQCYIAIAKARAKAGQAANAREGFEKAKQIAADLEGPGTYLGMFPTVTMYKTARDRAYAEIAIAQAESGDVAGATTTLAQVGEESSKAFVYLVLIIAQAKAGSITAALETLNLARAAVPRIAGGWEREEAERELAIAPAKIAEARAKVGDIAAAKAVAARVESDTTKTLAYRLIGEAQAAAGDLSGARDTFNEARAAAADIRDAYDRSIAYTQIGVAQTKAGETDAARQSFKDAAAAAPPASVTMTSIDARRPPAQFVLAEAQLAAGDVDGAIESIAAGAQPGPRCWFLTRLTERYCRISIPWRELSW